MKKLGSLLLLLLGAAAGGQETLRSIGDLSWLTGCWAADGAEPGNIEQWMAPAGGAMLGASRVVRGGRMVAYEYTRIITTDDALVFIASPSGQETAEFPLKSLAEAKVVFENPDHDFPQRIIYKLIDQDRLLGRIEGQSDGKEMHVEFPMTRIDCGKAK